MNMNETEGPNPQVNGIDFIRLKIVASDGDQLDRLPMALMKPHEAQCKENLGQNLNRMAELGGLNPVEALAIIEGWNPRTLAGEGRETATSAYSKLTKIVSEVEARKYYIGQLHKGMRRFFLDRKEDETGVSGAGIVAYGVQWLNGEMVLHWPSRGGTTAFYKSADQLIDIHGHDGKTVIEWID